LVTLTAELASAVALECAVLAVAVNAAARAAASASVALDAAVASEEAPERVTVLLSLLALDPAVAEASTRGAAASGAACSSARGVAAPATTGFMRAALALAAPGPTMGTAARLGDGLGRARSAGRGRMRAPGRPRELTCARAARWACFGAE
jgi:hypothetical protein